MVLADYSLVVERRPDIRDVLLAEHSLVQGLILLLCCKLIFKTLLCILTEIEAGVHRGRVGVVRSVVE